MIYNGSLTYYNSDFAHHGVKGMKWGVRKSRSSRASRSSGEMYKKDSRSFRKEEAKSARKPGQFEKKKVVDMTDNELQQRINRMRLEQQYSELTSKGKEISKGAKFVKWMSGALQTSAQAAENASKIYKSYNAIFGDNDDSKKTKTEKKEKKEKREKKKSDKSDKDDSDDSDRGTGKVFEGTVEPTRGSSKRESHSQKRSKKEPDVVDAEYWSDVVNTATSAISVVENFANAYSSVKNAYGNVPMQSLPAASNVLSLPPARR